MKLSAYKTSPGGFVLVEAATALFVVAVALFGVIQMLQYSVDKLDAVNEHYIAKRILVNELETLRAAPFDSLTPGPRRAFTTESPEIKLLHDAETWVAIVSDDERPAALLRVDVHIQWTSEYGRRVHRQLTTLIARRTRNG